MRIFTSTILAVLLSIQAIGQAVQTNAQQLDFGQLFYNAKDSILVTITNSTSENVTVDEITFTDVDGTFPFRVSAMPLPLQPFGTSDFYVIFEPVQNVAHNGEMIIKTSGNRGAVAIDLLGNCVFSNPYYNTTYNKRDEALKTALQIRLNTGTSDLGYNNGRDKIFMEIDNQKVNGQGSAQNRITRAYLGTDAVGYVNRDDAQGSPYNLNTEHTFPQGFFNNASPMRSDMHHLFVTDVDANSTRGSYRFGNVVSAINWQEGGSKRGNDVNGNQVFEPRDGQKGRTARATLYFLMRYQNYSGFVNTIQEETLREWNAAWPVTEIEENRNTDIYSYQGNRNPMVDYPQLIDRIYNLRTTENRPATGQLIASHTAIDYGNLGDLESATFALVLTNAGLSTLTLSDIQLVGNSTSTYSFEAIPEPTVSIAAGESYSFSVLASTSAGSDDLQADLTMDVHNAGITDLSIPISASLPTGLAAYQDHDKALVYPNPTSGVIVLPTFSSGVSTASIYDISGQKRLEFSGARSQLDLSSLASGFYHLVVATKAGDLYIAKVIRD